MILRNPPSPRLRWPAALAVAALAVAALPWSPTLADDKPRLSVASDEPRDPPRPPAAPIPARVPGHAVAETERPVAVHFTSEHANQLKDELELLVAQRETKQALVRVAEADLKTATVKLANTTRLAGQNVVSQQEVDLYRNAAASAEAQLTVRKAELKEQDVKIAQAKRRLERATTARLTPPATYRVAPPQARRYPKAGELVPPAEKRPPKVDDGLKQIQDELKKIAQLQRELSEKRRIAQIMLQDAKDKEAVLKAQETALQQMQQILELKAKEPDSRKP